MYGFLQICKVNTQTFKTFTKSSAFQGKFGPGMSAITGAIIQNIARRLLFNMIIPLNLKFFYNSKVL